LVLEASLRRYCRKFAKEYTKYAVCSFLCLNTNMLSKTVFISKDKWLKKVETISAFTF